MPVCGNYLFFELPKKIVLNPKDGNLWKQNSMKAMRKSHCERKHKKSYEKWGKTKICGDKRK